MALVERELVGGECSFYACMPSKALLRPPELLAEVGRVPGAAEAVTGSLDVQATLDRRDEVIHDLDDSAQLPWIEDRGITLVRGEARLDGERRLTVRGGGGNGESITLVARDAVILATGSGAAMPPIPGLADAGAWSNRQITTATAVPPRLVILGGGVVGVEMAQAWSALGSRVTVIEAQERLIGTEEPIASEIVATGLSDAGVEVICGVAAESVSRDGEGVAIRLADGRTVTGDRLLVAVGRRPWTDGLGLETVDVEPGDGGYLEVDDQLRVGGSPWLYAIGDCNGRALLTHAGKYQARIAADVILGELGGAAVADTFGTPRVVFTDPQVTAAGMTAEAARARYGDHRVAVIDLDTNASAGASFHGRGAPGRARFVVDTERAVLVGVCITGPDVAEWIHGAAIAIVGAVPLGRLAHVIAPFPTRSELWLQFLEAYEQARGVSVHTTAPRLG